MTGSKLRDSGKPLFKKLQTLTFTLSIHTILDDFLIHNLEYFAFNLSIHSINIGKKPQLQ
jgi:hypothetical protein